MRNRKLYARIILKYGDAATFADHLGVNRSYISGIMNGKAYISKEQKKRFAAALKCSVKEIFPDGDTAPCECSQ